MSLRPWNLLVEYYTLIASSFFYKRDDLGIHTNITNLSILIIILLDRQYAVDHFYLSINSTLDSYL